RVTLSVRIAFFRCVAQTQLDGVDAELDRKLVHRRLQREIALWGARRPVCVDLILVGRYLLPGQLEVGNPIRAAEEGTRDAGVPAAGGAVVVVVADAERDKLSVALGAELEVELRPGRGVPDHEILLAIQSKANGPAGCAREQHDERLE